MPTVYGCPYSVNCEKDVWSKRDNIYTCKHHKKLVSIRNDIVAIRLDKEWLIYSKKNDELRTLMTYINNKAEKDVANIYFRNVAIIRVFNQLIDLGYGTHTLHGRLHEDILRIRACMRLAMGKVLESTPFSYVEPDNSGYYLNSYCTFDIAYDPTNQPIRNTGKIFEDVDYNHSTKHNSICYQLHLIFSFPIHTPKGVIRNN